MIEPLGYDLKGRELRFKHLDLQINEVPIEELSGQVLSRGANPKPLVRSYIDSKGKPYSVQVKYLVIHATASHQTITAKDLQAWFLRPKTKGGLGWSRGGYHVMIEPDGNVVRHHPNETHTNGVRAYKNKGINITNQNSINISWIGGIDRKILPTDNRTPEQTAKLKAVIEWYLANVSGLILVGHNQIENKPCPCFDHIGWLKTEFPNLPSSQIYEADNFGYLAKYK